MEEDDEDYEIEDEDYDECTDTEGDDNEMDYYADEREFQVVVNKVSQECLIPTARRELQKKLINEMMEVLAISEGAARILLRGFNWNTDRLQERYFEDAAKICEKFGVLTNSPPFVWAGDDTVECGICYMECTETAGLAVGCCKHFFCIQCFGQYFASQLSEKGTKSLITTCPENGCTYVCERVLVLTVLREVSLLPPYEGKNTALITRYENFHEGSYVDDNPCLQHCPAPRCENCVKIMSCKADEPVVAHCLCGLLFCFKCCEEDHTPASCDMLRDWLRKEQDESETANWMVANTKHCPGCGVNIEKNDGCNHITCQSCSYDFCWVCEKEWSKHGSSWYQCNFYEPSKDTIKDKRDIAKEELTRYIFYYTRYSNHDRSKHLEKHITEKARKRIAQQQQDTLEHLHQVEYLQEAAQQLIRSRETLKYTYVYAYNLSAGPKKSLFEYNQAQLEHSTETLSRMLQSKTGRQDIINQQAFVKRSLERLQQGVYNAKKMAGRL